MRVVGTDHIYGFLEGQPGAAAGQVLAWLAEAQSATWRTASDLGAAYPRAMIDAPSVTFLLAERTIAIATLIVFVSRVVHVTGVTRLRETGTGALRRPT